MVAYLHLAFPLAQDCQVSVSEVVVVQQDLQSLAVAVVAAALLVFDIAAVALY